MSTSVPSQPYSCHECIPNGCASQAQIFYVKLDSNLVVYHLFVAVWLTDRNETTLKHFFLENGRVRLQPANPEMKPIMIDDPSVVQVQGRVMLVVRQLN